MIVKISRYSCKIHEPLLMQLSRRKESLWSMCVCVPMMESNLSIFIVEDRNNFSSLRIILVVNWIKIKAAHVVVGVGTFCEQQ
jgi:hypothetical protein